MKRILSSNRLMKFLIRYQLILEYVKIKNLLSIRLEVCIWIKPWLGYCPYKVFSIFSFHLAYLRFLFNFSILVSVVEYVKIFMFLISIFDLQPICLICFQLWYLAQHITSFLWFNWSVSSTFCACLFSHFNFACLLRRHDIL